MATNRERELDRDKKIDEVLKKLDQILKLLGAKEE